MFDYFLKPDYWIIKTLPGFSSSTVQLCEIDGSDKYFIKKIGNVSRNIEKLKILKNHIKLPDVFLSQWMEKDTIYMSYINGLNMEELLSTNGSESYIDFIVDLVEYFKSKIINVDSDFSEIFRNKLSVFENDAELPFTISELINRLPKKITTTLCHGDLTMENIIYSDKQFYLIDPVTTEYNSYVFDIAKLRQDLDGKWFLRNNKNIDPDISLKLTGIKNVLIEKFPEAFDDYIYILMLLRVYLHTKLGTPERHLILTEIKRLWT